MIKELFSLVFKVVPDKKDNRDYLYREHESSKIQIKDIPNTGSTAMYDSLARNQGIRGTCVAFATASAGQQILNKNRGVRDSLLSVEYINDWCEERDNHPPEGTYLRLGAKYLQKVGVGPEEFVWPYNPEKRTNPPEGVKSIDCSGFIKAKAYYRAFTIEEVCKAIHFGFPVLISIPIFSYAIRPNTKVFMVPPSDKEISLGLHAVKVSAYDLDAQRFRFLNSWGWDWGDCGYGYISFGYFEKFVKDIWVIEF